MATWDALFLPERDCVSFRFTELMMWQLHEIFHTFGLLSEGHSALRLRRTLGVLLRSGE